MESEAIGKAACWSERSEVGEGPNLGGDAAGKMICIRPDLSIFCITMPVETSRVPMYFPTGED